MPEISLIKLKSFSSHDSKHSAENLLTARKGSGKWLTAKPRKCIKMEASFQLEHMCKISSVHIGNIGSAFITLLVTRGGSTKFETLLPCSGIRSLQDSKLGRNKESVKMYFQADFIENISNEKWDELRVVVMQPYNLDEPFGLSFLNVYSFSEDSSDTNVVTDAELQKWERLRNSTSLSKSPGHGKLNIASPSFSRGSKLLEATQKRQKTETSITQTEIPTDKDDNEETLFKLKVYSFMDSLNLEASDLEHLRLIELEENFEEVSGKASNKREKLWFIDIVRSYLKNLIPTIEEANTNNEQAVNNNTDGRVEPKGNFSLGTKFLETECSASDKSTENNAKTSFSLSKTFLETKCREITKHKNTQSAEKCPPSRTIVKASSKNKHISQRNLISLEDSVIDSREETEKPHSSAARVKNDESTSSFTATKGELKQGQKRKLLEEESDTVIAIEPKQIQFGKDFIECPICNVLHEPSIIEAHSAECNSFSTGSNGYISEVPCPVCKKLISAEAVDVHADRCAYIYFGN